MSFNVRNPSPDFAKALKNYFEGNAYKYPAQSPWHKAQRQEEVKTQAREAARSAVRKIMESKNESI